MLHLLFSTSVLTQGRDYCPQEQHLSPHTLFQAKQTTITAPATTALKVKAHLGNSKCSDAEFLCISERTIRSRRLSARKCNKAKLNKEMENNYKLKILTETVITEQ